MLIELPGGYFASMRSLFDCLLPPFEPEPWQVAVFRASAMRPHTEAVDILRCRGCSALDRLVAVADYHAFPALRQWIHRFKYLGDRRFSRLFGECLAAAWNAAPATSGAVFVPVPLHWWRRWQRGFNQAEILASETARLVPGTVSPRLRRVRATGRQVGRGRSERRRAVQDAFAAVTIFDPTACVVLVDDVCTTGATLDACARACKLAGAARVEALVLARD